MLVEPAVGARVKSCQLFVLAQMRGELIDMFLLALLSARLIRTISSPVVQFAVQFWQNISVTLTSVVVLFL